MASPVARNLLKFIGMKNVFAVSILPVAWHWSVLKNYVETSKWINLECNKHVVGSTLFSYWLWLSGTCLTRVMIVYNYDADLEGCQTPASVLRSSLLSWVEFQVLAQIQRLPIADNSLEWCWLPIGILSYFCMWIRVKPVITSVIFVMIQH